MLVKPSVLLAQEEIRSKAAPQAARLGSLAPLGDAPFDVMVFAAAPEADVVAVARSVAMQDAAVEPSQQEIKSGPPSEAQAEQKAGVHATLR